MKKSITAFGPFCMDAANRTLARDGEPIEVSARYFDALALMVSEPGQLITKDRFIDEVWRGVPVTDEALTQGIRALRKALGDDAANPSYIETVPKHGYRFVAPVEAGSDGHPAASASAPPSHTAYALRVMVAGMAGAGVAGGIVGIAYGAGASAGAVGGLSLLLVMTMLTIVAALLGGVGIAFGLGLGDMEHKGFGRWSVAGAAFGGLVVGAILNLIFSDAFSLLLGGTPPAIAGGMEGALLGGGLALGAAIARKIADPLVPYGAAVGAAGAGVAAVTMGGHMFGGSIQSILLSSATARLSLDPLGRMLGSPVFDIRAETFAAAIECALFAGFMLAAIRRWHRRTA